MMDNNQYILKPAQFAFIIFSIFIAFILNIFPNYDRYIWMPDILVLTILFWAIREPYKINIGTAFILGLLMDIKYGNLLGETAIFYIVTIFLGLIMQRRLMQFSFIIQALHLLPILLISHGIIWLMHYFQGQLVSNIYWIKPAIQIVLWPILSNILVLPQKFHEKLNNKI